MKYLVAYDKIFLNHKGVRYEGAYDVIFERIVR